MTNTILLLVDVYGIELRISADKISDYVAEGLFTNITVAGKTIAVQNTAEEIDASLAESYFMIKRVGKLTDDGTAVLTRNTAGYEPGDSGVKWSDVNE